jgi:uncharacterized radical SAM protein YgiQ
VGRLLEAQGFRVGVIAQPDWQDTSAFEVLGAPNLFFGITAGNMDSMINHYTAQKKKRSEDAYSPNGVTGKRPDRATLAYTTQIKAIYKDTPIVLGGIEASLRRLPHYDYWSDKIRNSLIFDAKADILVYGMGENPLKEIMQRFNDGFGVEAIQDVEGTVVVTKDLDAEDYSLLPEFPACKEKELFLKAHQLFEKHNRTKVLYQAFGNRYLRHNPPAEPLSQPEMDEIYGLFYSRKPHPSYGKASFKAFDQIKESVTSHRGCFGGCNFCAIGCHQGKSISSRSQESIINEIKQITEHNYFKGTVSDIGGPSANMYQMSCRQGISKTCPRLSCIYPNICPHLNYNHKPNRDLLDAALNIPKVKHVFVASGIRFDLAMNDKKYIRMISERHSGGHLKLAPEHAVDKVLKLMNKPSATSYLQFCEKFSAISKESGKQQQIIPYLIVGHPGTTLNDAIELALFLKRNGIRPEQVQEFTPTPMSISTTMYYTELDYSTGKKLPVPKGREIRLQKALAQWFMPANRKLVHEALQKAGRLEVEKELYGGKKTETHSSTNKSKDRYRKKRR